jgi:biopolymer transport protein ExbB
MTLLPIASAITSVLEFFLKGGFSMFLLIILSVVALAVVFLRAKALVLKKVLPPKIIEEIERLNPGDSLDPLYRLTEDYPSPLGRIVATIINHLSWSKEETIEAIQTKARAEVVRLETGVIVLEISTGIAPLLGLLGTLSGLVGVFTNLGPTGDPVGVARGISEALNATIMGLVIAIPSLVAFNYFSRKVEIIAVSIESISADLMAKCYPKQPEPFIRK